MSRSKTALAVLMLLALACPALSESESLISQDMISNNTVNYKTFTVELGTYELLYSNAGSEYFPNAYEVRTEISGARFKEFLVKKGDEIKKGDALAVLTREGDVVAMTEQRIVLENLQSALERGTEDRREAMEEMKEALLSETDRYEYELLRLRILRAEVELEQFTDDQNWQIQQTEAKIAELEEQMSDYYVLAPADGVVSRVGYFRPGELVYTHELLVAFHQPGIKLLRLENAAANVHYGMDVIVDVGHGSKARTYTGRIVGADLLVPEGQRSGYAYVEVDADPDDFSQAKLKVPGRYLENVMIIPRKAIKMEAGKYYVMKLVDGVAQKRYVNCISKQGDYAWVLQGLEVGEEIIID